MAHRTSSLATPSLLLLAALLAACGGGGDGDAPDGSGGGGGDSDPALIATWTGYEVGDTVTVWTFSFGATDIGAATGGTEVYAGNYTVDTAPDPHHLTVEITEASYPGYVGETTNGIYAIDADTMMFAAHEPGDPRRPSGFTPSNGARVFELTRQ